jgi:hypothetical protein
MDISAPGANAADPSAGAGWKQNLQGIGNAFNYTLGTLRVNNGQLAPTPNPNQGPAQAKPGQQQSGTLASQAQALLQKGVISQEQYQRIMSSIGGAVPSTGMPEMIAGQSQGPQPLTMAATNPVNGPSPISPAWGG